MKIPSALGTGLLALARWAGLAARAARAAAVALGRYALALEDGLVAGTSALGSRVAARIRRAGTGARARRGGQPRPAAPVSPRSGDPPRSSPPVSQRADQGQRAGQGPSARLTARGAVVVVFGTCFLGLLIADWANWPELADAVFFMSSSLTAYYVRPGSLLPVAVSPPLLFFVAMALEKLVIAPGMLAAFSRALVALADAAPWLFAGTALTVVIALLRGLAREVRTLVLELRDP